VNADVFDRILKALLPGKPLDVAAIAHVTGEPEEHVFAYLGELLKQSMVTYTGDPLGVYTITEPGIVAAIQSVSIRFELLQEKLGQPEPATETVAISKFNDGAATLVSKATYACGCVAYREHPAVLMLTLRINPCKDHTETIKGYY
jgi:hypothetical protein